MKTFIVLSVVVGVAMSVALETYPNDYDYVDVEKVVGDVKLLRESIACYMGDGPCSELAAFYKKYIFPEAFYNACAKCTTPQKTMLRQFFEVAPKVLPDETAAFQKKIDPEGKYAPAFIAALAKA